MIPPLPWTVSTPALPNAGGYRVILADPPWSFATWSHRGQGKGASQHYDVMRTDDIAALPVSDLCAASCTLYLWGTWPHLPDALRVIEAWGFAYRSCGFVWVKQNRNAPALWADLNDLFLGLGYGTRGNTEFCLRAVRGKPKFRAGSRAVEQLMWGRGGPASQLLLGPLREHSRKPDEQYGRIETLHDGPYLEMFARVRRPGWDAWGNQTERFAEAAP